MLCIMYLVRVFMFLSLALAVNASNPYNGDNEEVRFDVDAMVNESDTYNFNLKEKMSGDGLRIWAGTWNVGGFTREWSDPETLKAAFQKWMEPAEEFDVDVYIFAFQEYDESALPLDELSKLLMKAYDEMAGADSRKLMQTAMEMKGWRKKYWVAVGVFERKTAGSPKFHVTELNSACLGNNLKRGVCTKPMISIGVNGVVGTSTEKVKFNAVGLHLSAGEGNVEKVRQRRGDFAKAIKTIYSDSPKVFPEISVMLGDYNFRTQVTQDLNLQLKKTHTIQTIPDIQVMLLERNELQRQYSDFFAELSQKNVPVYEGKVEGPPSYKLKSGTGEYKTNRVPSYTDRVLVVGGPWREKVKYEEYKVLTDRKVWLSDHLPVFAVLSVFP